MAGAAVVSVAGLRRYAAREAARRHEVVTKPPYDVPAVTRQLHERVQVEDLHADVLLWRLDLRRRGTSSHMDLPRLREAGVAVQVFAAVTQVPAGLNFERNTASRDLITMLTAAQGWPPRTWGSRLQRALYQAERLHRMAEAEQGRLVVVRPAEDVGTLLERRAQDPTTPATG